MPAPIGIAEAYGGAQDQKIIRGSGGSDPNTTWIARRDFLGSALIRAWLPDSYAAVAPLIQKNGDPLGGPWPGGSVDGWTHAGGNQVMWQLNPSIKLAGSYSWQSRYSQYPTTPSGGNHGGALRFNFSDAACRPNSQGGTLTSRRAARAASYLGLNQSLFVQWGYRCTPNLLQDWSSTAFKLLILGAGDQDTGPPWVLNTEDTSDQSSSCTDSEIVSQQAYWGSSVLDPQGRSAGIMPYHSCVADPDNGGQPYGLWGSYYWQDIKQSALPLCSYPSGDWHQCAYLLPDVWSCHEIGIEIGPSYDYCRLRYWFAANRDDPPILVFDTNINYPIQGGEPGPGSRRLYNLLTGPVGGDGDVRQYGKLWLLNYITNKPLTRDTQGAPIDTFYSEVLISKGTKIPFPNNPTNPNLP